MAGKKLKAAKAQVDRERLYQPLDAVRLLKSFETARSSTRPSRRTSASASTCATPTSSCAGR